MKILCETSVRHVHLSRKDVLELFGRGELTRTRDLSQPGQYLCEERVDLVTPKATLRNVAIIGPTRDTSQVEISRTDCFALGLKGVPVRQSGDLDKTPGITIQAGDKQIELSQGVIVAHRHVHLDPQTAEEFNLRDGDAVTLRFGGERGGTLNSTIIRVSPDFAPAVHIDSDEANAMGFSGGEVILTK